MRVRQRTPMELLAIITCLGRALMKHEVYWEYRFDSQAILRKSVINGLNGPLQVAT